MHRRPLPPLNAIKAFEAASRHLSITRAADELGVTPGAVSRQVRALEQHLRTVLFVRGATSLALTPDGEDLFAASRTALDGIATASARLSRRGRRRRPLAIGAYTLFASRWLIPRWQHFFRRGSGVEIELTTTNDAAELSLTRFDAVITVSDGNAGPGFTAVRLLPISVVPVCAPSLLTPDFDLRQHRLLHSRQRPQDWRRWLAYAGLAGIDPESGLFFESIGLAVEAATEGLGIAIGIRGLLDADLNASRVAIPIPLVRPTRRWFTLVHPDGKIDPALRGFSDWLRGEATLDQPASAPPPPIARET